MNYRIALPALVILVIVNIVIASSLFLFFSREQLPPPLPHLNCVSYTPMSPDGVMIDGNHPISEAEVGRGLLLLKPYTDCVRTYSTLYGMAVVPKIAKQLGMTVVLGVWLDEHETRNMQELSSLKEILKTPDVSAVQLIVIGNEVLYFDEIPIDSLIRLLSGVRKLTKIPVTTADMENAWVDNPQLVDAVDVIGVHIFPYWQPNYQIDSLLLPLAVWKKLENLYPEKRVMVLETGWPSGGNARRADDVLNVSTQRQFFAGFAPLAAKVGMWYNVIEAFDQPWKINTTEIRTGPHWGILSAAGGDKVVGIVQMHNRFILFSFAFAFFFTLLLVYGFRSHRKMTGHIVGGFFVIVSTYVLIWIIIQLQAAYILNLFFYILVAPSAFFMFCILSGHVLQAAYVAGEPKKLTGPVIGKEFSLVDPTNKVSIHIPCRNEDPKQMIRLIGSCLNQTYKNFEVIVIDNNTKDVNVWQPVKTFADRDPRVKFYHYETLSGFKAGALDVALQHTAPDSSVIAVLDADYEVSPEWLETTLPYLNGKTAVVQAPQDYRTVSGSPFERLAILEAKIFFEVGMKIRAGANAIIQHGTMCLIDKKTLLGVGGWPTETIVEDADLGVKILERGLNAVYVPIVLGQGIAPQNFSELTRQRFRWAYGSVQILKNSFKLFFWKSGLSLKQRFNFIAGWIFWWLHFLYPVFIVVTVLGTYYILTEIRHVPIAELSYLLFYYLVWTAVVNFVLYRKFLKATFKELFLLLIFGASLTYTLVKAVIYGLATSKYPFLNTRKKAGLAQKIKDWEQGIAGFAMLGVVLAQALDIYFTYGFRKGDLLLWQLTLILVALPSIATMIVLVISYLSREVKTVKN